MQQTFAEKRQDNIIKRARDLYREEQDAATERVLGDAYKAAQRARALLAELRGI